MKSLWNNFKVAFAMFSKIPMPRADWTKENMKYMFCFFPFIGTVIGGLTMLTSVWVSAGIRDSSAGAGTGICDRRDPCGWSFGYFGCPEFLAGEKQKAGDS